MCKDQTDLPCGGVGTYRILRGNTAMKRKGFYSANEFILSLYLEQKVKLWR